MNNKEFPEEGEILLGTVERVVRTNVFVKLDDYGKEGVMSFSEVSPGRIRNIRKYVVPGQKIVCKVLRVDEARNHIDLSLRRVSTREKKEVLEIHKRGKDALAMMGVIVKEKKKLDELVDKIKEKFGLGEFLEELMAKVGEPKESLSMLKKVGFSDEEANRLLKLISEKIKERRVKVKEKISLSSEAEDGVEIIKKILGEAEKKAEVSYLGASYYSLTIEDKDYKEANKKLKNILDNIERMAKEFKCNFKHLKEKK
ncbi:MAG: S1 RNA-binding domain-containing protein [Candidatus Pacearchaeota archaeon]|nr:MAG: S1 RNA-binding domain-containing protein [Candidatus Pacearchaeota archaeon]